MLRPVQVALGVRHEAEHESGRIADARDAVDRAVEVVAGAVADGDLVQRGNSMAIVWGDGKLKQDLALWVTERYGIDRFHPTTGSILPDFIGSIITDNTKVLIQNELLRLLDNYRRTQFQSFKKAPQNYSYTELLNSVEEIDVNLSFDTVHAKVRVTALDGTASVVSITQGV